MEVKVEYAKLFRTSERVRERKLRTLRARRKQLIESGICIACKKVPASEGIQVCLPCRRKATIYQHIKNGRKRYLACKSSPERPARIWRNIKFEQPEFFKEIQKEEHEDAKKWMDSHIEMFHEPTDTFLWAAVSIDSLWMDEEKDWIEPYFWAAWLERTGGLTLEDYVIQKVDLERERRAAYV